MSVVITSRTFYDEFTDTGGGGVTYLNGGIGNRMKCVIEFYTFLGKENSRMVFDSATKTITNGNRLDTTNFISDGWLVGMTIDVIGTVSNNGTYTITAVESTVITVAEALVNETDESCSFYDTTPITSCDFLYNIIPNGASESYASLTDRGNIQKYVVDGIASGTATPVYFLVGSNSMGWVTNEIIDTTTGETNEVFIEGAGITDYKQAFTLTQWFTVTPLWLNNQDRNFANNIAPDYLILPNGLKYIFRINAKFDFYDPIVPHTGGISNENGMTCWYNANNTNTRSLYNVTSIKYTNYATSEIFDSIDFSIPTKIVIELYSVAGSFLYTAPSSPSTAITLDFIWNDLNLVDFTNTPDTTLRQNFMNDRLIAQITDPSTNGEYFGTDYQIITDLTISYIDANNVTLTFQTDFATYLQGILSQQPISNRNYSLLISTQDETITTTKQNDRVVVLVDYNQLAYDQTDATLIEALDEFHVYQYPNIDANDENYVLGWGGDPFYVDFPFLFLTDPDADGVYPSLRSCGMQVVAVKTGEDDFVIESTTFDTGFAIVRGGVQDIDLSQSRSFIGLPDEYNTCSITRDDTIDTGTQSGYRFKYAFALRYEYWLNVIQTSQQWQYPIYQDITDVSQLWETMVANGWTLQLKFVADAKGYDDHITNFWAYTEMDQRVIGSAPDGGITFTCVVDFINEDDVIVGTYDTSDPTLYGAILIGTTTKIRCTFYGDFTTMPIGFNSFYGYLFMDLLNSGGINNRRFAQTEFDSETGSPFTFAVADPLADLSWNSANMTINLFYYSKVTLECWYDDTVLNWAVNNEGVQIYPKLGFLNFIS